MSSRLFDQDLTSNGDGRPSWYPFRKSPACLEVAFKDLDAWKHLDWTVEAGGYRLVIEGGAMTGLAYDEWPYPWGDPRYGAATLTGSWDYER